MLHPLFAWASHTEQPRCSLLLCLFHTDQTAVASIPRPGGCRDYVVCHSVSRQRCLLSLVGYLLGDLPVSSLIDSDPAWPARLLTRTFKVLEHLRGQMHPRCLCTYSLRAIEKTEKQNSAMDASECLCLAVFLRKLYNTSSFVLTLVNPSNRLVET